jgi:hypothetical protein
VPLLRANLDAISRKKRFKISAEVKKKLATVSRPTVERLLADERKKHKLKGKSATKKGTLLKNQIPVRRFWAWNDKQPGFCEIDTVSHDGGLDAHGGVTCRRKWEFFAPRMGIYRPDFALRMGI